MSENFTRRSMRVVRDTLRAFASEYCIIMGIDDSDNRPNIIRYVFYDPVKRKGAMVVVDYMQVKYLDNAIDTVIKGLCEEFNLEV